MKTDITNGSSFSTASGGQFAPGVSMPSGSATRSQTANQSIDSSVLGDPAVPGGIEFRVARAGESLRRLRLTGNRYTFGNADGCTIRLNDPDLRPMHAVLIREGSRVIARSYSVPVEVNGTETNEATLQVGDVLKLGLYEFELIRSSVPNGSTSPGQDYASSIDENRMPARRDLPATDEVVWRERLRREVDQWRQRQEDCDRRESRIDEREAEMRSRESELWSRSDNLHRRETRVQSQETETFQLYDEFAQRQQELMRLQDESNERQEMLQRREVEFREQEFEYRRRLAEATAQLDQSKLQADSATQAVGRMREQFDALNAQIEELSKDQQQIEAKEVQQSEEYQRVREELETAKAEAEQGRQDSERQREEAENRAAELAAEIEELKSNRGFDSDEQRADLEESKRVTEQLRDQVAELQKSVADASAESSQLKTEYEQSSVKVQELETLVSESQLRGDEDRDQWATEAEQLRAEVERLSGDLSAANNQLNEVREANDSLNERLSDIRQERDDACVERDARPTTAAFEALRNELDQANDQLTEIKRQYDEMLDKMDEVSQSDTHVSDSGEPELGAIPAAFGLAATIDAPESSDQVEIESPAESSADNESEAIVNDLIASQDDSDIENSDTDDDDPWPTYQSTTSTEQATTDVESNDSAIADEPATDSVWQSPNESETSEANSEYDSEVVNQDDNQWQPTPPDVQSDDEEAEVTNQWAAPNVDQEEENDEVPDWQSNLDQDSPEADADDSPEATADDSPSAQAYDSPSAVDDDSYSSLNTDDTESEGVGTSYAYGSTEVLEPTGEDATDQSDSESSNIWSSLSDDTESEDVGTSYAWGSTEVLEPTDEDATDQSDSEPSNIWSSLSDDSEATESDSADADIAESVVSGSLASSLIQDLNEDRIEDSYPDTENLLTDNSDSNVDQCDQPAESTHEGTFVLEESSEPDSWSNDEDSSVGRADSDNGSDDTSGGSPWDDVSQRDHDFLDGSDDEPVVPIAEAVETPAEPTVEASSAPAEDDDSIEAYMNRLLRRVQGDGESTEDAAVPESISVSTSQSSVVFGSSSSQPVGTDTSDTQSHPIDANAPLVPRSQAPERAGDLSAMRDLANSSARSAISRSARVQSRDTQIQAMVSFTCAIGALACNALAFYFVSGVFLIVAVAMTFVVAFICFREGMHLLVEAQRRVNSANSDDAAHEAKPVEESPAV